MRAVPFLLVWVVVLLAACGGDEGPSPSRSPTPAATATATALPPIDGTVPPQGFGGTDPVDIKSNPDPASGAATLVDVRVGAHPEQGGWDRIVFEFKDVRPKGRVEYVTGVWPDVLIQCGSGDPVSLPGGAVLRVKLEATNAHDEQQGRVTIRSYSGTGPPRVGGPGNSILEAKQSCDFEALVYWGIGTSGRQRFTVRLLDNPTRVVIDVKW